MGSGIRPIRDSTSRNASRCMARRRRAASARHVTCWPPAIPHWPRCRPAGAVRLIDMTHYLCPADTCPAVIGNLIVYRDDNHITRSYMRTLTPRSSWNWRVPRRRCSRPNADRLRGRSPAHAPAARLGRRRSPSSEPPPLMTQPPPNGLPGWACVRCSWPCWPPRPCGHSAPDSPSRGTTSITCRWSWTMPAARKDRATSAFHQSLDAFVSLFWSGVALVASEANLRPLFLALLLAATVGTVLGAYAAARAADATPTAAAALGLLSFGFVTRGVLEFGRRRVVVAVAEPAAGSRPPPRCRGARDPRTVARRRAPLWRGRRRQPVPSASGP